ncbi:tripartite tricarboxylate transporter TctB family protein [Thauera sp. WH-1]|uniref:tripartite tricarboxylate transporter TctB family protein n=1 Tax=Thauera sp. WH-1 TaxID=3398230 RepID=UPI0039FC33EC
MDGAKKREVVIGAAMLVIGLAYLYLTTNLPRKAFIDAAFVPYLLAAALCLLGALQLLAAWRQAPTDAKTVATGAGPDYLTVGKTLGLIVGYIAILEWVGFPLATVAYLYLQFLVLTPLEQRVSHGRYLLIAVCAATLIFVVFRHGFDLLLPAGLLDFIE